jgi:hypothetical protein
MPKIIRVTPIAALPTPLHLRERVDNPSPDGEWNIVFHTPREWHMGATGWQVKLFHRRRDVTRKHRDFFRIAEGNGFRYEPHFQPWSFDSKSLGMVTWDETPVHIYDVAATRDKLLSYQPPFGFVYSAQFAPDMDRLLLTFPTEGVLVNQAGEHYALIQWAIEEGEAPNTHWLKTGKCFFLLGPRAVDSGTKITFYSGVDGALKEAHDVNPEDLVPYDSKDYVELPRDRPCLVSVDLGFRCVGSLLDTWSSVRFDQALNTLFLGVFRPVSSPYREGGELVCKVKEVWVAVELDPN